MKRLIVMLLISLQWGCTTKAPIEHQQTLQQIPAGEVEKLESMDSKRDAIELKFNTKKNSILDSKSPVMVVGKKSRSYFQRFKITPNGPDQFIEIRAFPYKPLGFGQIGIIQPLLFAFDEKGKTLSANEVFSDYDHSFVDGDYYRAVWRLRGLDPKQSYFLVVAANTDVVGQKGKDLPNYGGAAVGIMMTHSVQFSPVGTFAITQSDSFKK